MRRQVTAMSIKKIRSRRSNYGNRRSKSSIRYIVFHYTGNRTDTAKANANYFKNNYVGASAHYFVDAAGIIQSVPDDYVAWSVGSRGLLDQGSAYASKGHSRWGKCTNSNSISIEMCCTNGKHSKGTLDNAYALGEKLAKKYGINDSHIIRHFDVNGKLCPLFFVTHESEWKKFKAGMGVGSGAKTKHTTKVVLPVRGYFKYGDSGWKVTNLEKYLKKLGYYKGAIDGGYGSQMESAVTAFEKHYKLKPYDGQWGKACQAKYKTLV
ncbi:putative peptidoglycan binding protein [Aminicella lysinilytica]|uniref:N-acetylmuramoyl-L-alanine amidase n=2 Tax=Aminicella lysinilytica TaxID=433323 RepID=A0A4R6QBV2_9FIRM|nr:putative peptidoglycan binding protein [Aminicella lysinilytica]